MADSYDEMDDISSHGVSPLGDGSDITGAVENVVDGCLDVAGEIVKAGCDIAGGIFDLFE
jgi:hypothetical protein